MAKEHSGDGAQEKAVEKKIVEDSKKSFGSLLSFPFFRFLGLSQNRKMS